MIVVEMMTSAGTTMMIMTIKMMVTILMMLNIMMTVTIMINVTIPPTSRYTYSMVITFMYQSVLINKLTMTQFERPVDTTTELLLQDLTPLVFEKSIENTKKAEPLNMY